MLVRPLDTDLMSPDMKEWTFRLRTEPMFLPDVYRDVRRMTDAILLVFSNPLTQTPQAIVQPDGRLCGVFYVGDIVPEHEATFYLWSWDGAVTPDTARAMTDYIDVSAKSYALRRITCRTPDERLGAVLERLLGFSQEGRFKFGFRWSGKLMTLYQYRILRREG